MRAESTSRFPRNLLVKSRARVEESLIVFHDSNVALLIDTAMGEPLCTDNAVTRTTESSFKRIGQLPPVTITMRAEGGGSHGLPTYDQHEGLTTNCRI
jgi:hypothetical protein